VYRCGSISSHAFAPVENQRVRGVLYIKITDLGTEGSNVAHRAVVRGESGWTYLCVGVLVRSAGCCVSQCPVW